MVEETELVTLLPAPGAHIVAVSQDIPAKREGQREDMFRNRIEGIIADVRDGDAMRFAIGFVHDIGAGGRDRDQFKIGKPRKRRFAHRHLVDNRDCRILKAIDDLVRRGHRIFLIAMRKSRCSQIGLKSRTVEKDDRMLHGVIFP